MDGTMTTEVLSQLEVESLLSAMGTSGELPASRAARQGPVAR